MMRYFKNSSQEVYGYDETQQDLVDAAIAAGWEEITGNWPPPPPPKTPEQIKKELERALDEYIDSVASAKGYDSRITATMRAGYTNPWQAEGIAFGRWMDSCYTKAYEIMADVQAGTREIPTEAELIAEMPSMVWPE